MSRGNLLRAPRGLRPSRNYDDLKEMMSERGLSAGYTSIVGFGNPRREES
jgi:hypothetical protein